MICQKSNTHVDQLLMFYHIKTMANFLTRSNNVTISKERCHPQKYVYTVVLFGSLIA